MCDSDPSLEVPSVVLATPDSQVNSDAEQPLSSIHHDHTYFSQGQSESSTKGVEPGTEGGESVTGSNTEGVEPCPERVESKGVESSTEGVESSTEGVGSSAMEGVLSQELFSEGEEEREEVLSEARVTDMEIVDTIAGDATSYAHLEDDDSTGCGAEAVEPSSATPQGVDKTVEAEPEDTEPGMELEQGANKSILKPNPVLDESELRTGAVEPDVMELGAATLLQNFEDHNVASATAHPSSELASPPPSTNVIGRILDILPSLNMIMENTPDVTVEQLDDMSQLVIQLLATINTRRRHSRNSCHTCNNLV